MSEEAKILFKCVVGMAEFMGLESKLQDFLGLGGPERISATDITDAVQALFDQEELAKTVSDASTALANTRDAFTRYEGITDKTTLLSDMKAAAAGDDPFALKTYARDLTGWITGKDDLPTFAILEALSFAGALWCHVCVYWRERAKVETSSNGTNSDLATMRLAASNGLADIPKLLAKIWQQRISQLSYDAHAAPNQQQYILDHFFDGGARALCLVTYRDGAQFPFQILQTIWDIYPWVLWGGDDAAPGNLRDDLGQLLTVDQADLRNSWNADFVDQSFNTVVSFGQWMKGVRQQLIELDLIASDIEASGQEGWSWCDQCGVLYWAPTGSTHCPGAPQGPYFQPRHGQQGSANYVLRHDAVTVKDHMQDGWRWCKNCGELFFADTDAKNVCPVNQGPHDGGSSGNYVLGCDVIPPPEQRGFEVQDGWRWCKNCCALHYSAKPGRCPSGGQHATDKSGNYWLPHLGNLPRTYRPPWNWSP